MQSFWNRFLSSAGNRRSDIFERLKNSCAGLKIWTTNKTKTRFPKLNPPFIDFVASQRMSGVWFLIFYFCCLLGSAWQGSRACRVWWGRLWTMSCRPTSGTLSTWTRSSPLCSSTCRVDSARRGECAPGKWLGFVSCCLSGLLKKTSGLSTRMWIVHLVATQRGPGAFPPQKRSNSVSSIPLFIIRLLVCFNQRL